MLRSLLVVCALTGPALPAAGEQPLAVDQRNDRLIVRLGDARLLEYVFRDEQIRRPYFAQAVTTSGVPVTRNHPPQSGIDALDHDTMHPGLWLAFGDVNGVDFWRNRGLVEHVRFAEGPVVDRRALRFTAIQRYRDRDRIICVEEARHAVYVQDERYLLTFDSRFSADADVSFGDQEEMGLGLRMATPLVVKGGSGVITSSERRTNESEVWGRQAAWCDYSGVIEGRRVGMLLVPHPKNFRRSWFHARDYGLLVANPFGQKAFTQGEASRVVVKPGESLRLRFGVWVYSQSDGKAADGDALAAEYLRLAAENR